MFSEHSKENSLQFLGLYVLVQICNLKHYWITTGYTA
jgi:hypothetical protein